MRIDSKYLHLRKPVELGYEISGWHVCWLGGWDKGRVFYVVMVVRVKTEVRTVAAADGQLPFAV
jgi:hypothetical protein